MFRGARTRLTLLLLAIMLLLYAATASFIYVLMYRLTVDDQKALLTESAKPLAAQVQSALDKGQFPQEFVDLRALQRLFPRLSIIILRDAVGDVLADTNSRIVRQLPRKPTSPKEILYLSKSGIWVRMITVPLANKYGQREGELQLALNITSDHAALLRLRHVVMETALIASVLAVIAGFFTSNQVLQPIARSWQRQRQFVADASHEIRSPLTVIQANLDVVLAHTNQTVLANVEWLSNARTEVTRLGKLTDDLLTLARIDSNQSMMEWATIDLSTIVEDVCESMAILAMAKAVTLEARVVRKSGSERSLYTMTGDHDRMRQLAVILIDNAIKYTPSGGRVEVKLHRLRHEIRLDVSDTGIGIRKDDLHRVFDRFFRSDTARARSKGGVGLGLSIAHWIVSSHRGRMLVHSQYGTGSTFTVVLPTSRRSQRQVHSQYHG